MLRGSIVNSIDDGRIPLLHGGHAPPHQLGLLQPLLQLLLPQLVFDIQAEGDGTFGLLTVFSMVTTQGNQLLADGAATIVFALAAACMRHHPFHLLTALQATISISALTSMNKRLDAALD